MRVLHIATRFLLGGSEQDILRVIAWEQRHGHEVHLAIGGAPGEVPEGAIPEGVVLHYVPQLGRSVRLWSDWRALRALRRLIRDGDYDMVHTHQSKAGIVGRVAARGAAPRIVHTVHMASFGPSYGRLRSQLFSRSERYCGGFTDLVVCVGEELKERYARAGVAAEERFAIMRTPIEVDRFARARSLSDEERAAQLAALGVADDQRVLLSIGALEPRKRQRLLIDALAPLLRRGETVLLLAGEGEERPALEARIAELGLGNAVRLLGHRSDLVETLACSDALLLASLVEGVPRVIIEALSAGVPIVATDVEGLREVPGAPIRVVDRAGDGLLVAVESLLEGPVPDPVPLEALDAWRSESVDEQIAAIHARAHEGAPAS